MTTTTDGSGDDDSGGDKLHPETELQPCCRASHHTPAAMADGVGGFAPVHVHVVFAPYFEAAGMTPEAEDLPEG